MRRPASADRRERDLIALVAHDVRTPLAVISGYAGTLCERWGELTDAEKREGVAAIARSGKKIARMVDEGLLTALAEPRNYLCELVPFDLGAQVQMVVADMGEMVSNIFRVRIEDDLPLALGDEPYNAHVLGNLLSNAVKFSPAGACVDVDVRRRGKFAVVSVRDRGVGIAPADIPKIFKRFGRAGAGPGREAPGTGLGLHLIKRIIEAQHGQISVRSRPGSGSTFSYTLPLVGSAA